MSFRWIAAALILVSTAGASELKRETIQAWQEYVHQTRERMEERAQPGHSFLWIDSHPELARRARAGENIAVAADPHMPRRVPSGLIHHWIGVSFIPGATLGEIISIVRNYPEYSEYFRPNVANPRLLEQTDSEDHFSMVLVSKTVGTVNAVESDYQVSYYPVDATRVYSLSSTTRVQQVEEFHQPGERRLPEGTGNGYIWRLASITRLEERDGGVWVEIEALALSRDIPASLHWLVDPIVRRVSRSSLLTTLKQTREAVPGPELHPVPAMPATISGFRFK